ncbi:uncharacterized protein (TIGR00369 family) [Litorimonas taeanensis]|uniref:Uncharacterized protein (TIGR00369 family) n=1 Tax=Litorimonas taeanensis TaxID=568099 RepID=A0A420WFN3_9PROT|nr:PaaI family thioesterase [Litorimonas taeanensis]RKQ69776.1 uncharacterized protein (TIGR00369 family) [Litorimonas taeanensis]
MSDKFLERLWEMAPGFITGTPHAQKLGMKFVAVDKGRATMSLPYNPEIVGDKKNAVIHGGAVTTLLDQASGLAAVAGFDTLGATATLSLRIDYMRAATPEKTIIAEAHCYKATKHVAFIRAVAHQGDENDPVATSQACFMATGPRVTAEDMA